VPWARGLALALLVVVAAVEAQAAHRRPTVTERGIAVSADPRASEAGASILRAGGNAIDAAVATAFAISVVEPYSAGIGGGGFAVVRLAKGGEVRALDFRERAPRAATRDMYVDDGDVIEGRSTDGHLSVGVPGTVAGLKELHAKYGKLPWRRVVQPAIKLAAEGFEIDASFVRALAWRGEVLSRFEPAKAIFFPGGKALGEGDRLRQRDLAATLRRISRDPRDFYVGRTATLLVKEMEAGGGLITKKDLADYRPTWRDALCGDFRAHRVCSMPPPSSGGVHLLQMLNLLSPLELEQLGWHHPDTLHWMIESMRVAYADRSEHLGDPDAWKVPVAELTSSEYASWRRAEIQPRKARASAEVKPADVGLLRRLESKDTSHLSVVDKDRNAVSLTFTVNYGFGSGVVAKGTGVLLNDEMDDFSAAPGMPNAYGLVGGEANAIAPWKIPLSSMSPTIVTKGDRLVLVTGSPGGSTIITTVLQTTLNVVVYGMDAGTAVGAARIHHQWQPEYTRIEDFGLDATTRQALQARGHVFRTSRGWGNAMVIVVREDGKVEGAADPRGTGAARAE
jgi:gamma-glutamyltranspeptidase/glutathione hydrolase